MQLNSVSNLRAKFRFARDFMRFRSLSGTQERFGSLLWSDRQACLADRSPATPFDAHYVYHTAWAARILNATKPVVHTDISSYLYFATIVSAFIPVHFYEYRPANLRLSNMASQAADLLALPFSTGTIRSLSCMHVVEHIGLGRYGDDLAPSGDLRAMSELVRVLAPGGQLLFVVPVGRARIRFNAHRIYSFAMIADAFARLRLHKFALVDDQGNFREDSTQAEADQQQYGCGCFWFVC